MPELNKVRRPNKNGEFLLDVMPTNNPKVLTIYDISLYLPIYNGIDRDNRLAVVKHVIAGKNYTVYIIDYHNILNRQLAVKLAKDWFNGKTTYHRLD